MKRALFSPAARDDLFEIWFYISGDNERAADTFIDRLESTCQVLANSPGVGRHRPELGQLVHSFALGNYVVFYEPDRKGIKVLRVLHGARDIHLAFGVP